MKPQGQRLRRSFYARPSTEVAPSLIGATLWHDSPEGMVAVRIVETEAYGGGHDPGSHGYRGMTPRTAVMFGPPGFTYVYFTYGMHFCLNFVTGVEGVCSAVLIRAGEPLEGIALMQERRSKTGLVDLASGPGKLAQALGLNRDHNGRSLCEGSIGVTSGEPSAEIVTAPRVGISRGVELPWRFAEAGSKFVSRPRPK